MEAFWVAIAGILGTLLASIIPPIIQRNADRDRIVIEKYLDYRIQALQELEIALFECQSAFLRITGEPVESVDGAKTFLESVNPKLETYFRAQMLAEPYILNPDSKGLLPENLRAFNKLKNGISAIVASRNPSIYPVHHQFQDGDALRETSLKLFAHVSELLNPKLLQDFHQRSNK
jgi:hypothetical protein